MDIKRIIINKNRGWRGLAELRCYDSEHNNIKTMMFSFSQPVWDDMLKGCIVIQDETNYYVLEFNNADTLPRGQRSVLIKNFNGEVTNIYTYPKVEWQIHTAKVSSLHHYAIYNFIRNRNNHTTSDWNCIGIRVVPMI